MVAVQAGLIGPQADGTTPQQNPLDVERFMFWASQGQRSGIIKGLVPSVVAGQMQLSFTAGAACVRERDASQVELDRAYPLYSPSTAVVQFGAASASNRNDAVVAAVVDVEDGAQGTGAIGVGGHLVVVPGVSGTTSVRTDAQIAAYLGRGGFHRLYDVPIASGSTQINLAGATFTALRLNEWNTIAGVTAAAGWTINAGTAQYMYLPNNQVRARATLTKTSPALSSGTDGNLTDTAMLANWPAALRPVAVTVYGAMTYGIARGLAGFRIDTSGGVIITDFYPNQTIAIADEVRFEIAYTLV
jgi:hypothetical protein